MHDKLNELIYDAERAGDTDMAQFWRIVRGKDIAALITQLRALQITQDADRAVAYKELAAVPFDNIAAVFADFREALTGIKPIS